MAQAKYDCWVEQQEEGHQPTHIAACRDAYMVAVNDLKTAVAPEPTPAMAVVQDEIARQTVYFDFDKATITGQAQTKIDNFVAEMKKIQPVVTLYIAGHADTTGSTDTTTICRWIGPPRCALSSRVRAGRSVTTRIWGSRPRARRTSPSRLQMVCASSETAGWEIIARGQVTKIIDQSASLAQ